MPVHNSQIASIFERVADILEIQGANPFRVRAYRNAARTIESLPRPAAEMVKGGSDLTEIKGIGRDLADKIIEITNTGGLKYLNEISASMPPGLLDMLKIPGMGPKRTKMVYDRLGIGSIEGLKQSALEGKLRALEGFGEKTESNILQSIADGVVSGERTMINMAEEIVEPMTGYLKKQRGIIDIIACGSYRRRAETIGDLDILSSCRKADASSVMDAFTAYDEVERIVSKGVTRSTVVLKSGMQADLRIVERGSFGAAMQYFTGSKAHNIEIRKIALKKGLKINEYGVFRGDKKIAGKTEQEVYESIGLSYMEPEIRENRGEIEAAIKGRLPRLVSIGDIKGDLHSHTSSTDGRDTLHDMAIAAKAMGYEYIAITEHSKHVTIARGLDEKAVAKEMDKIDRLNLKLKGIIVLKGIEVDILEDGKLDLDDGILNALDVVAASVHYKFNLPAKAQTDRIIKAMDNPRVNIIAHPTGRLINERKPYDVEMERLLNAAKARGVHMELNAHPSRLDLNDTYCKLAKDIGVKIAISTDAHNTAGLSNMRFGIGQARRGWIGPFDVINARSLRELKKLLKR